MLDTVKTLKDSLQIAARSLATANVYPEKMRAALSADMLATDLAEYLVRKGQSLFVHIYNLAMYLEHTQFWKESMIMADGNQRRTSNGSTPSTNII
jgi:hypothetical protein